MRIKVSLRIILPRNCQCPWVLCCTGNKEQADRGAARSTISAINTPSMILYKTNFIAACIKTGHYRSTYLYQLSFCKLKNTKYKHRPRPIHKSLHLNNILQFPVFSKVEYVENAYKNSDNDCKINIFLFFHKQS
jgi:hypothetical protein